MCLSRYPRYKMLQYGLGVSLCRIVPKDFDGFGFGVSSTVREEEGLGSVFLMLYAARATSQASVCSLNFDFQC